MDYAIGSTVKIVEEYSWRYTLFGWALEGLVLEREGTYYLLKIKGERCPLWFHRSELA